MIVCSYCEGPLKIRDKARRRRLHRPCLTFYNRDKRAESRARRLGDQGAPPRSHKRPGRPRKHHGCKVAGCPNPHRGLGYCGGHLYRFHRQEAT